MKVAELHGLLHQNALPEQLAPFHWLLRGPPIWAILVQKLADLPGRCTLRGGSKGTKNHAELGRRATTERENKYGFMKIRGASIKRNSPFFSRGFPFRACPNNFYVVWPPSIDDVLRSQIAARASSTSSTSTHLDIPSRKVDLCQASLRC